MNSTSESTGSCSAHPPFPYPNNPEAHANRSHFQPRITFPFLTSLPPVYPSVLLPSRAPLSSSTPSSTTVGSGGRHTLPQPVNTRAARLHSSYSAHRRSTDENGNRLSPGSVHSPSDDDTLVQPYSSQSACSSSTHTAVTLSHSTSHLGTHQHAKHPGLLTPGSIRHPLSSILQPPSLCDPTTRPLTLPLSRCPSTTYSLFSSTDTVWFPLPQHSPTTGGCASAGGTPILA